MTTLIAVYNSDGLVGRCDEKCYGAVSEECTCICGGKNHGAGFKTAAENTRQMAMEWIKEYADRLGLKNYQAEISDQALQLPLFEVEA